MLKCLKSLTVTKKLEIYISGSAENALDTEAATASEGAELEGESKVATEIEEDLQDDALYFSRIKDIQEGLAPISQKLVSE